MNFTVPQSKQSAVITWCHLNVSPRLYYMHNRAGGEGWDIVYHPKDGCWTCTIRDEQMAFMYTLKFGA